jgi:hypothetical protein
MKKSISNLIPQGLKLSVGGLFVLIFLFAAFSENQRSSSSTLALPSFTTSPSIPETLTFCGEEVPLHYFDVVESLERELIVNTYFHSQTLLYLKKASRYFPVIEPILQANNIPEDFKYLVVAESGFAYIVSPMGAAGFWQLLENTAKDYGLEVNEEIDERYHLEKATEAACKFLNESHSIHKNWTMVAATYNAGRKGIDRQIERQGESNYYDLLLNEETARYVFRILAIKVVFENPMQYGFNVPESERYQPIPFHEILWTDSIGDIGVFAKEQGTNYKLLKMLNPWLRDNKLQNDQKKTYRIKIPDTREYKNNYSCTN